MYNIHDMTSLKQNMRERIQAKRMEKEYYCNKSHNMAHNISKNQESNNT